MNENIKIQYSLLDGTISNDIELTQTEFGQIKSQLQIDNLKPVNI